jgi:hypothetical protein
MKVKNSGNNEEKNKIDSIENDIIEDGEDMEEQVNSNSAIHIIINIMSFIGIIIGIIYVLYFK